MPQSAPTEPASEPPKPKPELPLGGRELFPRYRLVGFCGTPGAPSLGKLQSHLPERAKEIAEISKSYAAGREAQPIFAVDRSCGAGWAWPGRQVPSPRCRQRGRSKYLRSAREAKALLLLNVQPGHSDFMTEVKAFEKYLHEPDVGVALDPEWAMKAKQVPGKFYGQTTGERGE